MSKNKTNFLDFEEEEDFHIDFASINTGLEGLDIDQALKSDGPVYDNYYHKGFCYYNGNTVFYAKDEGEKITDIAKKFNLNIEYLLFVNNSFFADTTVTNRDLISLGNASLLHKEIASYTPIDSTATIFAHFYYGSEATAFGFAYEECKNVTPLEKKITKKRVNATELSPATGVERYSPLLLANKMHSLFPGEKNNLSLSESKIDFAINLTSRVSLIFTVSLNGGMGLSGSVTDDRRFTTSVNWKLGGSGGIDVGILNADIGIKGGGSLNTFDQLNGSYESIDHFLAHFHNTFRVVLDKSDLDPKEYGLDDKSSYWKTNKKALSKGYTSVSKVYHALNANAEVGLDEKLGVHGEYKKTTISRVKRNGINKVGTEQSLETYSPDLEFIKASNDHHTDTIFEQATSVSLDVPLSNDLSVSATLELTKVMNDANKDNNGDYLNFQIQLPITEIKSTDGKISGSSLVDNFTSHKESIVKAFSSIKGGLSSLSALENELGRTIVATVYHKKNASEGGIERILDYKQSITVEVNAYQEGENYHIQYLRFWFNNEASMSTQKNSSATSKGKKMSVSITATNKVAFAEIVMEDTLSYISTVYNQMMWEARDTSFQKSLTTYLKQTKLERLNDKDSYKEHDALILERLEALQKNEDSTYSCTDWELFKNKHSSAIKGIKNKFQEQFNKEWVKLNDDEDVPDKIMGFDIHRHFGKTKEQVFSRLGKSRFKNINSQNILIITGSEFEELVLFKNYLENRSYASDYWK
ncbi:hypothetical protein [Flammeovirga kamogawensis]|uniref:LysM domain-containing protein n=1 Tax=Flammeovirga kamogawensis TaxID=373891 RepID=A0ABX8GYL1_9BACT|nr:hypothetical protein [Flammeovirga kamogawensis]MBB6458851.1 hypothetical protein [Flammeovirga kamogawensis]QWG08432.1 hypothetical protein KM029_05715 [Flammeovirga kamogawensis]TRX66729.1 hypothetical protein EO216_00775 [Flammeovirga kamogawensis]